jgi:ketosteroid isomerase-like protein
VKTAILLILLALSIIPPSAHAQHRTRKAPPTSDTTARSGAPSGDAALIELEKQFFAAIREKNLDRLNGILADGFAYVIPGQPDMTRAQFLKYVQSLPDAIEWLGADDMRVRTLGDVAIVTGVRNMKTRAENGTLTGSNTGFADVFRRNGEDWELVLVHAMEMPAPASSRLDK